MPSSDVRRSGRARQPAKKYSVDAFDGLDLEDDTAQGPARKRQRTESDDDDDVFEVKDSPEDLDDDPLEDAEFADEAVGEVSDAGEQFVKEEDSVVADVPITPAKRRGPRTKGVSNPATAQKQPISVSSGVRKVVSRGLLHQHTRSSKESMRLFYFGAAPEDQQPALQANYKWKSDTCLPSRKSDLGGFGGFHRGYYRTETRRQQELTQNWNWYDEAATSEYPESGKEIFRRRQTMSSIDLAQAQAYLPQSRESRKVVMGPVKEQKLFNLDYHAAVDLNEPFKVAAEDGGEATQSPTSIRHGWLLNLGEKIQSLDWAPNQEGNRQYLAVTTEPLHGHATGHPPYQEPEPPGYTPQEPYKASIQIWEFTAGDDKFIHPSTPPRLRKVVCTEWGDIKSIKWCPVPRKHTSHIDHGDLALGLLAGVWGDGSVRVLDVYVPVTSHDRSSYVHCTATAFTANPPHTISTSVTWLSATGLAIAYANGSISVFHLPSSLTSQSVSAVPVLTTVVQITYIISMTSCYPSRPNMIITSSMSGHLSLTDLTEATSASAMSATTTVYSARSRIARPICVWLDWAQLALTVDDGGTLQGCPIRRFYGMTGLTKYTSNVVTVAASPVHPFVMTGTIGGEVVCTNPLRRVFDSKAPIWNVKWFKHEWRRITAPDTTIRAVEQDGSEADDMEEDANGENLSSGIFNGHADVPAAAKADTPTNEDTAMPDAPTLPPDSSPSTTNDHSQNHTPTVPDPGLIRIISGFKAEPIKLGTEEGNTIREQGAAFTTIYEMETAITAVAWNPNLAVGGWCAAGAATGLLRVEDVAR